MRVGGLQKITLLDFPGQLSAIVFTQGCNFSCPYCHNSSLFSEELPLLPTEEILSFLSKRKALLDGVVISGGEPTVQPDLIDFCHTLKKMGYLLKLDTNGSNPQVLQELLAHNLLDYVAMDIKSDPHNYPKEICSWDLGCLLLQSMDVLAASGLPYEFRCTCVPPFVTRHNIIDICLAIQDHASERTPLFLQKPKLDSVLRPEFFTSIAAPTDAEMEEMRQVALLYIPNCQIR